MNAIPKWLGEWRNEATTSAQQLGLPARNESWKYTALPAAWNVDTLRAKSGTGKSNISVPNINNNDAIYFQFVDGKLHTAPANKLPGGITLQPLSAALCDNPELVQTLLGPSTPGKTRSLVALNLAEFTDGLLLHVPHNTKLDQPIVMHTAGTAESVSHLRVLVHLERGAEATLLQLHDGEGDAATIIVNEFRIHENARLQHYRLQREADTAHHFIFTESKIDSHGALDHFSLTSGAALSRHEITTELLGDGAECHVNAAALLHGTQHADFTSIIHHNCEHGQSRQTVKNVLAGKSRGVFQGKIHVHEGAQKTDGYQMNQALLLSPQAEINAKPELEIYADDVKCSHGATQGQLDANALFYLQSRGIAEAVARALLVTAFLNDAIELISHGAIREWMENALSEKLAEIAHAARID